MPEATVDEKSDLLFGPGEVWLPSNVPLRPVTANAAKPEELLHFALGRATRCADGRHDFRPNFSGDPVHRRLPTQSSEWRMISNLRFGLTPPERVDSASPRQF